MQDVEDVWQDFVEEKRRIDLLRADIEISITATEGYEQYLEDIKRQFMTIVDQDIELSLMKQENRELQYYKDDKFLNIKMEYRAATITLDRQIKQQRCSPTRTMFNSMALPRLKIPIFNGKYEEWPTFQDIFTTMIETNANISMVEKMQYLKIFTLKEKRKKRYNTTKLQKATILVLGKNLRRGMTIRDGLSTNSSIIYYISHKCRGNHQNT